VSENPSEVIKQCTEVLERIIGDDSVPRNIRRSADSIKNVLSNENNHCRKERLWSFRILMIWEMTQIFRFTRELWYGDYQQTGINSGWSLIQIFSYISGVNLPCCFHWKFYFWIAFSFKFLALFGLFKNFLRAFINFFRLIFLILNFIFIISSNRNIYI